jgi:hypothetical protein
MKGNSLKNLLDRVCQSERVSKPYMKPEIERWHVA